MERNPMYSLRETNRGELDLLRSITPQTRAYVVEGNRIVKEITEELFRNKDRYYPVEGGGTYRLPLSEAYASMRGIYRKPEEQNNRTVAQDKGINLIKQRQNLIGLINNARSQLKINGN